MFGARETDKEDPRTRETTALEEHLGSRELVCLPGKEGIQLLKSGAYVSTCWPLFNAISLRERTNSTMTAGPSTRTHLLISASGTVAGGRGELLLGHPKYNPSSTLQMTIAMPCTRKQLKSYLRFWSRCILLSKE